MKADIQIRNVVHKHFVGVAAVVVTEDGTEVKSKLMFPVGDLNTADRAKYAAIRDALRMVRDAKQPPLNEVRSVTLDGMPVNSQDYGVLPR